MAREIQTLGQFAFDLECVDFVAGERVERVETVELRVEKWKGAGGRWRTMYCARRRGRLGWDCTAPNLRGALLAQTWKGKAARPRDVAEAVKVVKARLAGRAS